MKSEQEKSLEKQIKELALSQGVNLVGICSADSIQDKEVSDPSYLLPDARSVISIAVKLDNDLVMKYLSKRDYEDYLSFCREEGTVTKKLKSVGEEIKKFLEEKEYTAINCDCNFNYRNMGEQGEDIVKFLRQLIDLINKEKDEDHDLTEKEKEKLQSLKELVLDGLRGAPMDLVPNISHRCVAVAAGLGRIGWSGNLVTEDYGARVLLNSVITDAELSPDSPLQENPCQECRLCEKSCQGGLFSRDESQTINIAGIEETIAKRNNHAYCIAVCSGMVGQNKFKDWSTWSPYNFEDIDRLPQDDSVMDYVRNMFARNVERGGKRAENVFRLVKNTYLGRNDKPPEKFRPTCGFCQLVCGSTMEQKEASYEAIVNSGTLDEELENKITAEGY